MMQQTPTLQTERQLSDAPASSRSVQTREFTVSPACGTIELLRAEYRRHHFSRHSHPTAVIGVVEHGQAVVTTNADRLLLTPGSVLVIPAGVVHEAHSIGTSSWHYRSLYLSPGQIASIGCDAITVDQGVLGSRAFTVSDSSIAAQVIDLHDCLTCATAPTSDIRPAIANLLTALQSRVSTRSVRCLDENGAGAGLARVRQTIDNDPISKRSLEEMARIARLPRFTLAHQFSRAFGISPHAYALQRRIFVVCEMLAGGDLVSIAAHRAGFADQSHLTRQFISIVGVTPGEFRRAWKERAFNAKGDGLVRAY